MIPPELRHFPITLTITAALVLLCLTFPGCGDGKVMKPTSDSTPPALVWNVYNHDTGAQSDHAGSPTINAKLGEHYRLTLKAKDPEGVKSIQINPPPPGSGAKFWTCAALPGGENAAKDTSAELQPLTQNLAPDSDGTVLTSIFLIFDLNLTMPCQEGFIFSAGDAKVVGRASNYFGGATTEVIKFVVTP